MKVCSICGKTTENEDAPVLTISGFGNARYLCDECSGEMDIAISSKDVDEIEVAISTLGEKMNKAKDDAAKAALYSFIQMAGSRLTKIKAGEYDFAVDEKFQEKLEEEGFDEIPEELQETEEDKALDKKDAENQEKFDKVMNWLIGICLGITAVFMLINLFT